MLGKALAAAISVGTMIATLGPVGSANAECDLTIEVKKTGKASFTVNWDLRKGRMRDGLWKKVDDRKRSVVAGSEGASTYKALFDCGVNRSFLIEDSGENRFLAFTHGRAGALIWFPKALYSRAAVRRAAQRVAKRLQMSVP